MHYTYRSLLPLCVLHRMSFLSANCIIYSSNLYDIYGVPDFMKWTGRDHPFALYLPIVLINKLKPVLNKMISTDHLISDYRKLCGYSTKTDSFISMHFSLTGQKDEHKTLTNNWVLSSSWMWSCIWRLP